MGDAFGQMLPLAVAIALTPLQVIAVIALLMSERPRGSAVAFLAGWLGALTVVAAIALSVPGLNDGSEPSRTAGIVKLALGVVLIAVAIDSWRRRPRAGQPVEVPRWLTRLKSLGAAQAFGVGAATVANPKLLVLAIAGVTALAEVELTRGQVLAMVAIFIALASTTVIAPVAGFLVAGDRAARRLARLERWLVDNSAVITSVLLGILGVVVLGKGIEILS